MISSPIDRQIETTTILESIKVKRDPGGTVLMTWLSGVAPIETILIPVQHQGREAVTKTVLSQITLTKRMIRVSRLKKASSFH